MQQWYLPPSNYSCVSGVAFFSNNTSQHLSMRLAQVSFVVSQAAWLSPLVAPYNIYNHAHHDNNFNKNINSDSQNYYFCLYLFNYFEVHLNYCITYW